MENIIKPKRYKETLAAKELLGKQAPNILRKAEISVRNSKCEERRLRKIPKDDKAIV